MAVERRWGAMQIESALRNLKSVSSAKIVIDNQGVIQEIHLLIGSDRPPKQVVRDVESALMAEFGLQIDHRKISVAQKEDGLRNGMIDRLRWVDLQIANEGTRAHVTVIVERANQTYRGKVSGLRSSSNIPRLIASATLRAVEAAHGLQERFALEDISMPLLANRQSIVILISALSDTSEDLFIGSALVRQDQARAVIAATLDALNRRVAAFPVDLVEPISGRAVANIEGTARTESKA